MGDAPLEKIETEIDRFYNLMARKGKVKLDEACKELNLEKNHITKYIDVLTRSRKVVAKYPLIGQPYFFLAEDADPNAAIIKDENIYRPRQQEAEKAAPTTDEKKETKKEENKYVNNEDKDNKNAERKYTDEKSINNKISGNKKSETQKEDSQKHCTKCGNPVKPNARFCTKCGNEVKS